MRQKYDLLLFAMETKKKKALLNARDAEYRKTIFS